MLNTLTGLIPDCCGVSEAGAGSYIVSFPNGSTRPVTEPEILAATEIKARNDIEPVSAAQFQLALLDLGLLDEIESYIATYGDRAMQLDWAKRQVYERDHPRIEQMRQLLGKTHTEVDAVFALAKTK